MYRTSIGAELKSQVDLPGYPLYNKVYMSCLLARYYVLIPALGEGNS